MTDLLPILVLGFVLGMRHATDADHVVAVTTIVARQRSPRGAALIGLAWGLGHTLTIVVVGGAILLFEWVIPPRIGLSMEFAVALMLIGLGAVNLVGVFRRVGGLADATAPDRHPHGHGDSVHGHAHQHGPEAHPHRPDRTPVAWLDRHLGRLGLYRLLRPLAIGVVHGLAGSAAVALLVLATISNASWAVVYLLVFGVGTIVGMMLITAAIAVPFAYSAGRFERMSRALRVAAGLASLGLGLFIAWRIGVVDGLFGASPQWDPH